MKRKFKTRLISWIMVGVLMSLNFATVKADTNQFNDVTSYYPYNSWAVETGKKYSLIFLENNNRESKRYEIASLLYYFLDLGNSKENTKFNDLDSIDTNNKNKINAVAEANIISGYDDGSFKPNNNVTRAEFVTMLDRSGLLKKANKTTNITKFSDTESHWAKSSIEYVSSLGLIAGKGNNQFCPDSGITPQEILIIADRMINIGCITNNDLLTAMQNTFKCKQYSDNEKYIPEIIFNDFDKIQKDMSIYRHSLPEYNYSDIGSLATLNDVLIWRYYYDRGASSISPYNVERTLDEQNRDVIFKNSNRYDRRASNGGRETGYYFGLDNENVDYNRPVTINEFIVPLYNYVNVDVSDVDIEFSNFNQFSAEEQNAIKKFVHWGILPDLECDFPGNQYMTKAFLNYITVKLNEKRDIYIYSHYYEKRNEYYTDKSNSGLPNNYYQYPFIVRPIDNEAYEIPFKNSENSWSKAPIEIYDNVKRYYTSARQKSTKYLNTLLNVDYSSISDETFTSVIIDSYTHDYTNSKTSFDEYIQYVKDNKIKLSGTAESYLPIFYNDGESVVYRLRVKVKFDVINSETNKNLIFGDLIYKNLYNGDVTYNGNTFEMYVDVPLSPYLFSSGIGIAEIFNLYSSCSYLKTGQLYSN